MTSQISTLCSNAPSTTRLVEDEGTTCRIAIRPFISCSVLLQGPAIPDPVGIRFQGSLLRCESRDEYWISAPQLTVDRADSAHPCGCEWCRVLATVMLPARHNAPLC